MSYFWILTLQWGNGHGTTLVQTAEGTMSAEQSSPARTRSSAFKSATANAREHMGIAPGVPAQVLFWSLEPELLDGAER